MRYNSSALYIRLLIWDTWNVAHIARHEVTPEEVNEVCHGEFVAEEGYKGRIRFVGPTSAGWMLAVVLEPQGEDIYYPITARPASRKERRRYEEQYGGENS